MVILRLAEAVVRSRLKRPHPQPTVQPLVAHVHNWDICRQYGYRYRICLNGCGQRLPC